MIPSEIPSNAPLPTPQSDGWGTFFSKWMGRIWTIFSYPLVFLISRVSEVAAFVFHSDSTQKKTEANLPPISNAVEVKKPKEEEEEINIGQFFESTEFNLPPAAKSPALEDKVIDKPEQAPVNASPPPSPALSPALTLKERYLLGREKRMQNRKNIPNKAIQKKPSSPRIPQFRRMGSPQIKINSSPLLKPSRSTSEPNRPAKRKLSKSEILDLGAGAGGDCQPLCLLKGLELQYPNLYKHEVDGKSVPYTVQDIRKMGADLAREHIDINWDFDYAEEIYGYMDADRKEYNEPLLQNLNDALEKELAAQKQQLDASKITPEEYGAQTQIINDKYSELKKTQVIEDNEVYLECLEKKGYYCSSLHLFAFSFLFEIPVHVHHFDGTKNHEVEVFNPKNSKKAPIRLQRSGLHYKLIVAKKIT